MKKILLHKNNTPFQVEIALASSKSESNRALILNALTGFKGELINLSSARDTQTMIRLLKSDDKTADVLDAGTTMRFLTAYFAITNQEKIMTGTPRMCERPIKILVDALREIGGKIDYLGLEGYPPLQIKGFGEQKNNRIAIRGDVSSQYISALAMIAPLLQNGLTIELTGEIGSKPYIEMTLAQMAHFGVVIKTDWEAQTIEIEAGKYKKTTYQVESDWSGASYWYSIVALADDAEVELLGLKEHSLQGDSAIVQIMEHLGVKSVFTENGVKLTKIPAENSLAWDFTDCPDLAQTVVACCAAKGIELTLTGIESLKIKETDRILALQNEVKKIGATLVEVVPSIEYRVMSNGIGSPVLGELEEAVSFMTYDDHRMAMAFAPLAMMMDLEIEEPDVVAKSYPSYWQDLAKIVKIEDA